MNEPTGGWSPQRTPSLPGRQRTVGLRWEAGRGDRFGRGWKTDSRSWTLPSGPGSPPAWLETQLVEVWLWPGAEEGCG